MTAAAKMLRPKLMTVVHEDLTGLLVHEKPILRRKAAEAIRAFHVHSDAAIGIVATFRQALCDARPEPALSRRSGRQCLIVRVNPG